VVLYFYQDGCPYCAKLLRENYALRDLVSKTRRHFDVIAINMWGDREVTGFGGERTTEKAFAADLRVLFTPTLLFLDEGGGVVLRLNGYYPPHRFESALDYAAWGHRPGQSFAAFVRSHGKAPASGRLHREPGFLAEPFRLASADRDPGGRPLLVLFEQRQCGACDELHLDVLQRPAVRAALQGFDVALLDVWAETPVTTPAGEASTSRDWARELGVAYVPTLVFFASDGGEVFRVEAYLKAFHVHAALDYVATGAYRDQPDFQRFLQARTERLRAQGIEVDLMD
jgi:thioredoxin-related protein